ncbi:AlbA family DNA-binding domain-containing protein [Tepidibacter formicigenes]|jgi:predicted HTH transcriptional regulator|uniref:Predicted transcriptional regulator, contains HTH domain n=1 Tax=Tepidibacter formicigenes DSM 15518 TaxID=1123349 RepID=A0A1M6K5F7_9FIRM|nr:RNA-binding domain-containing protein [Tepidibacter formicigenes]SHJ54155.1 Predicted transcriptional regulator, contains HTH domain [Tepidibacter formicigenes DSM 15518]
MDKSKLSSLLKKPEGAKLDYKLKISLNTNGEKKELAKDIAAIANTHGGRGYIIFGVEDKTKKIIGIEKDEYIEEKIQQILSNRIDPPVPIRMEYVEYEGKTLGILTIFKSYQRPHQLRQNGTFYIRRGSTTDVARRYEVALMFDESGIISLEMMPIFESNIDEIDYRLVYNYCKKINIKEEISLELLENLGICVKTEEGKYSPSLGGLLVFGKHPQRYILSSSIRVINELDKESIVKIFHGNIIYMLDEVEFYLKNTLKYYNYPIEGLYECIRNSLVHRDYFDLSREIVIYLGKNKVEVNNPGILMMEDTINSIFKEKNPSRRNNWIYQRLLILDDKMRFLGSGMGFNRIKKSFEEIGNVRFFNIYKRNLFRVILPGVKIKGY